MTTEYVPQAADVPPPFDAAALKMAIRWRHKDSGAVAIEELRTSSGMMGVSERYIDMWVIKPAAVNGCAATSYEIKISRSDFIRDMKQPLKHRAARLFSDQFFFVAPPGIIKPEEIPDWAGLLEPRGTGQRKDNWSKWRERELPFLDEIVPAPIRSKDAPSWPLLVAMLKREAIILPLDGGEVVQSWANGMVPPAQRSGS
jgi:hypothetical protein